MSLVAANFVISGSHLSFDECNTYLCTLQKQTVAENYIDFHYVRSTTFIVTEPSLDVTADKNILLRIENVNSIVAQDWRIFLKNDNKK